MRWHDAESLEQESPVLVQEEPPLDLSIPQVFTQPRRPDFGRNRLEIGPIVNRALEAHRTGKLSEFGMACGELYVEFQPGLDWAVSCWEYLLSTQGCRFLRREMGERRYHRSDYRPMLERDFPVLVRSAFKDCLVRYDAHTHGPNFTIYLRQALWPALIEQYQSLENPDDPLQRKLTGLSYLRCIPYQFLNDYHHELVYGALRGLPPNERRVIDLYFLQFQTDAAVIAGLEITTELLDLRRRSALEKLRRQTVLAYHLLLQIERY